MTGLDDVGRWSLALQDARAERDHAIMAARAEGATWQSIADAAGLTLQGVLKIRKRQELDLSPHTSERNS